jgi:hypothetical protein
MDLNINNYNLQDLLKLFKLDYNFSLEDLKNAKKIALKTHPDKSKLPKEIFLFFAKAYKLIVKLHNFRDTTTKTTIYSLTEDDEDSSKKAIISTIKNKKNFNKWFNNLWDETNDTSNVNGYGDWFKSNENLDNLDGLNKQEQEVHLNNKKTHLRSLILHNDINESIHTAGQTLLVDDEVENYGSDVFSKLKYDDLKHAHTETVIPVTDTDFHERQQFDNVSEFKDFRQSQNVVPLSYTDANAIHENNTQIQSKTNIQRAFNLAKEDEHMRDINNKWWGKVKLISN